MKSLDQMMKQCEGLIGTTDITEWENGFLTHVSTIVKARGTTALTSNQADCLAEIYRRHFA